MTHLRFQNSKRIPGFSLVELIVAIAILAILATVALPSYDSFFNRSALSTSGDRLYQELQSLKLESVKRNSRAYISVKTGSAWCIGTGTATTCDCNSPTSCNISNISSTEFPGVSLTSTLATAANSQYFDPVLGSFKGVTTTCTVSNACEGKILLAKTGAGDIELQLYSTGRISLCSTSGNNSSAPACN